MEQNKQKMSLGQRWEEFQPTKTIVFWSWVGIAVLTMIIGFAWGGWVTGGTAKTLANDAVVDRMVSICVGQFNADPGNVQKLVALKEAKSYQRDDYVKEQGWALMPGDEKPERNVADKCAKLLVKID